MGSKIAQRAQQYNKFMFDQLFACFVSHKTPSEQQTGRILDLLRRIPYFYDLNSNFGADYLILMIPLLQPYILRQGFSLMGEYNQYILLEGNLEEEEMRFQSSRPVQPNLLLDPRENPAIKYVAKSDCRIIKIKRGAAGNMLFQKKLMQKERERNQEKAKLKKIIKTKDQKDKLDYLKVIQFFGSLGEYDLLDLAVQSQIKEYSQGSITHSCGEDVEKIGCVLTGRVKLSFQTNRQAVKRDQGVSVYLTEGEWIGLEEYLWENTLNSNGEAASVVALIVWIPREVFKSKFNLKVNYHTMNRLMGLIETKKSLFDRSLDCRRKKEFELAAEGEALNRINAKLLEKISAMVVHQQKRKSHLRKSKAVQEFEMPDHLLHRSNMTDPAATAFLPKLMEHINLFPEQYRQTAISVAQLREMQRLALIAKIHVPEHKQFHSFVQQNPQTIYKTILNKIPHTYEPTYPQRFSKTVRESRDSRETQSRGHSNSSIYNNFRICKTQQKRSHIQKSNTLHILP